MATPFLIQRRHVAVKIETTEGVDAVPADADVIAPAFGIEYTPTVEMFEREVSQASFSRITQVAGERSAVITFATELKGSGAAGTVPANLSAPLRACGFSETVVVSTSVTYAPASASISSATVEVRESSQGTEARSMKIIGARGTVTFEAVKGDIVLATFTFTGKYIEPTDTAITQFVSPAITPLPESFLGAAISFQGVGSLKTQTVSLDIGNNVVLRNDANDATGNTMAEITGRAPTGSIDPEIELVATINFYNKLTTNAEGILTYVLGSTAGNITTVTAPKAQITGIAEGDRDGIRIATLDLQLGQSVVAGDDELSIAFT